MLAMDEDALIAAVDVIGRTGAKKFEIGYLYDDVPAEDASWWAHAQYKGTRVTEEKHRGPAEAAEALAARLLTNAQCQHCHKLVTLSGGGAVARDATLIGGGKWTAGEQAAAGLCHWRRMGRKWERGCAA